MAAVSCLFEDILFTKTSGVPPLEESAENKWGQRVPAFFTPPENEDNEVSSHFLLPRKLDMLSFEADTKPQLIACLKNHAVHPCSMTSIISSLTPRPIRSMADPESLHKVGVLATARVSGLVVCAGRSEGVEAGLYGR